MSGTQPWIQPSIDELRVLGSPSLFLSFRFLACLFTRCRVSDVWSVLTKLTNLYLDTTDVAGTIPRSWSALKKLVSMHFVRPDVTAPIGGLHGILPEEFSTLKNLAAVDLSGNSLLTGGLPAIWSSMTNLQFLNLGAPFRLFSPSTYHGQLSGSFPSDWGRAFRSMSLMALSGLSLSGPLPDSWGGIGSAAANGTFFKLDWNVNLTGGIPSTLCNRAGGVILDISGTRVNASLPSGCTGLTVTALNQAFPPPSPPSPPSPPHKSASCNQQFSLSSLSSFVSLGVLVFYFA